MSTFTIEPRGPFSLRAAADFIAGFAPAGRPDAAASPTLRLAFPIDGFGGYAGVALRERSGAVEGAVSGGADPQLVRAQVARILSLDHDGKGFADVGLRDPVVGRLQAELPGLRPVCFHSPYEAAAWSVISGRLRTPQAVRIRDRITAALGRRVEVEGETLAAFPLPGRLLELDGVEGLSGEKAARLRGVAEAALAGRLDPGRLRGMEPADALAELQEIRGLGPFYAGLVLVRAAGTPDVLPVNEPRVRRAAAAAYGLAEPPDALELERLAEPWRPFRTWVCLLLRVTHDRGARTASRGWSPRIDTA